MKGTLAALLALACGPGACFAQTTPPSPKAASAVNAANYKQQVAPCSIFSLFGTGFSDGTYSATSVPLPTKLGNTILTVNGRDAPLFYAGPGQINAQMPCEVGNESAATATVFVTNNGAASNKIDVQIPQYAPGIFTQNQQGTGPGAILDENYRLVTSANRASSGKVIMIYATGAGVSNPAVPTGQATPTDRLYIVAEPVIEIAGKRARVDFSGLTPGFVSLVQYNSMMPDMTSGEKPVKITMGNSVTEGATVYVQGNQPCMPPGEIVNGDCVVKYNNSASVTPNPALPGSKVSLTCSTDKYAAGCTVLGSLAGKACAPTASSGTTYNFTCDAPASGSSTASCSTSGLSGDMVCQGTGSVTLNLIAPTPDLRLYGQLIDAESKGATGGLTTCTEPFKSRSFTITHNNTAYPVKTDGACAYSVTIPAGKRTGTADNLIMSLARDSAVYGRDHPFVVPVSAAEFRKDLESFQVYVEPPATCGGNVSEQDRDLLNYVRYMLARDGSVLDYQGKPFTRHTPWRLQDRPVAIYPVPQIPTSPFDFSAITDAAIAYMNFLVPNSANRTSQMLSCLLFSPWRPPASSSPPAVSNALVIFPLFRGESAIYTEFDDVIVCV